MIDPTCELEGALAVDLGEGEEGFVPLAPGAAPEVHFGFQGGQHLFFAVHIEGADLERYDKLQVEVAVTSAGGPWEVEPGVFGCGFGVDPLPDGKCPVTLGERKLVLGHKEPLVPTAAGAVEVAGLVLLLASWPPDSEAVFTLRVTDPCGRIGESLHEVPPPDDGQG